MNKHPDSELNIIPRIVNSSQCPENILNYRYNGRYLCKGTGHQQLWYSSNLSRDDDNDNDDFHHCSCHYQSHCQYDYHHFCYHHYCHHHNEYYCHHHQVLCITIFHRRSLDSFLSNCLNFHHNLWAFENIRTGNNSTIHQNIRIYLQCFQGTSWFSFQKVTVYDIIHEHILRFIFHRHKASWQDCYSTF